MNDQGTLDLFRTTTADIGADLDRLTNYLRGRGWRTAKEIKAMGVLSCSDDRYIRGVAASSGGEIISGNSGYKLTKDSTWDEKEEFKGRLLSQARCMAKRAIEADKAWHNGKAA